MNLQIKKYDLICLSRIRESPTGREATGGGQKLEKQNIRLITGITLLINGIIRVMLLFG